VSRLDGFLATISFTAVVVNDDDDDEDDDDDDDDDDGDDDRQREERSWNVSILPRRWFGNVLVAYIRPVFPNRRFPK